MLVLIGMIPLFFHLSRGDTERQSRNQSSEYLSQKRQGKNLRRVRLRAVSLNGAQAHPTRCVDCTNLDRNKVNVNGGAIALAHPLAATGPNHYNSHP
jgi:hypothetical protein